MASNVPPQMSSSPTTQEAPPPDFTPTSHTPDSPLLSNTGEKQASSSVARDKTPAGEEQASSSVSQGKTPEASSNTDTKAQKGKKRGNPGHFQGEQLTFLQERIPSYLDISSRGEKSKWITQLSKEWFQKYPWHRQVEPVEFAALNKPEAEDGLSDEQRLELRAKRDALQLQIVTHGQQELTHWIHRQTQTLSVKNGGRAYSRINKQLQKNSKGAPKPMPDWKFFMSHPEHRDEVRAKYREEAAASPPTQAGRMKQQCQIAEQLFVEQTDDVKKKIAAENAQQHSARVAAFKRLFSGQSFTLEGAETLTDAEKALCRANLLTFIQPLLDAIRAHTGLFLTLLAGAPPQGPQNKFTLLTVDSGTIRGLKFSKFDSSGPLDNAMQQFMLFLNSGSSSAESSNATATISTSAILNDPNLLTILQPNDNRTTDNQMESDSPKTLPTPQRNRSKAKGKQKKSSKKGKEKADDETEEDEGDGWHEGEGNADDEDPSENTNDNNNNDIDMSNEPEPFPSERRLQLLHKETKQYLDSLPHHERIAEMKQLFARQSDYEFERKNNIIRNKVLLHELMNGQTGTEIVQGNPPTSPEYLEPGEPAVLSQLRHSTRNVPKSNSTGSPATLISTEPVPPTLVATNTHSSPPTSLASSSALPETLPSADGVTTKALSPLSLTSAGDFVSEPNPAPVPVSTSSPHASQPSPDEPDKSGWPSWISDAYNALTGENAPTESSWHAMARRWTVLESYYKFENPNGQGACFSFVGRPTVIAWWFQNRKPVFRDPPDDKIGDIAEFGRQWWAWWSVINPAWRERDKNGCIIPSREGGGEWDEFNRPGACGLLTVLMCLLWWRKRLAAPSMDWETALQDVDWVICELCKANKPHHRSGQQKRAISPAPDNVSGGTRSSKRSRKG